MGWSAESDDASRRAGRRAPPSFDASASHEAWSLAPQDLSRDRVLQDCATVEFAGERRPAFGPYVLLAKAGEGGMGVVYFGVNVRAGNEVAVKILPWSAAAQHEDLENRFVREARIAAKLRSEHLVGVMDLDRDDATRCHYLVMEFVRGCSAGKWLKGLTTGAPEADALDVCIAATKGLAAAHVAGVVHRDVKPGNIMIPDDPGGRLELARAKLADLGLARRVTGGDSLTGTHHALGTPGYMAPEQVLDAKRAMKPADVFAMGATLYALLTGREPFTGATPMEAAMKTVQAPHAPVRSVRPDVSPATAALLDICLAKDPARRCCDASALLDALVTCRAALGDPTAEAVTVVAGFVLREERGVRAKTDPSDASRPRATDDASTVAWRTPTAAPAPSQVATPRLDSPAVPPVPLESPRDTSLATSETASSKSWTPSPSILEAAGVRVDAVPARSAKGGRSTAVMIVAVVVAAAATAAALLLRREEAPPSPPAPSSETIAAPAGRAPVAPSAGLAITSEPPGAAVEIDGRARGTTPLVIEDFGNGRRAVAVSLPRYRRFETTHEPKVGDRAPLHALLVRETGALAVTGGGPLATVTLIRDGAPAKRYDLALDERGELRVAEVEAGVYAVDVVRSGFDSYSGRIDVGPARPVSLTAAMREHDALLTVDTRPSGAEVLLDGSPIGTTPMRARPMRPGRRTVTLHLPEHADVVRTTTFERDREANLAEVPLAAWPLYDFTKTGEGVEAFVAGKAMSGRVRLAPGQVVVHFRRRGRRPSSKTFHGDLDEKIDVVPGEMDALLGTLDLAGWPTDARCSIGGRRVSDGERLRPGEYTLHVERDGSPDADLTFTVQADARVHVDLPNAAAQSAAAPLRDLAAWDAAGTVARRAAAEWVAARERGFQFARLETFALGRLRHEVAVFLHVRTGLEFSLLPAGKFVMGSPETETGRENGETRHEVRLTRPFLLARTEFTQAAWDAAMGPARCQFRGAARPVETVSWHEATAACARLGFALPTEAQWEFACRAGAETAYARGEAPEALKGCANIADAFLLAHPTQVPCDMSTWSFTQTIDDGYAGTAPVERFAANAFGLHDMHGNVWEWCADGFVAYPRGAVDDPRGEPGSATRICRGGSWRNSAPLVRCATRFDLAPSTQSSHLGFRPARVIALD
jgi:formylglycine-generating enzyme required for sulfatase activity/serine/threonine protein kinase